MKMIVFYMLSRLLLEGCPLIAIHKVRYYKRGDGLALGPGPFVTALEFASDVKAEVVGKPQPSFFQQALEEIGCDARLEKAPFAVCKDFPAAIDQILTML